MKSRRIFFAALVGSLLGSLCGGAALANVPFWGDRSSLPVETPAASLKQGQWVWSGGAAPQGPVLVVVDLDRQLGYAYRNGLLIGSTTVSTGKKGYRTPTGVFQTLQKDKDHRSSIYNNAPMPYTQRLTWGGVALHAGGPLRWVGVAVPGHADDAGRPLTRDEFARVRMPQGFLDALRPVLKAGSTLVVTDAPVLPDTTGNSMTVVTNQAPET